MLSGPSGSGKSTVARDMLAADGNAVRLNRDEMRLMSLKKWTPKSEGFIIDAEKAMATTAAKHKRHIIIDDTNLTQRDEDMWSQVAKDIGYTFEKKLMNVDLLTCIARDSQRSDHQRIGRPAIERQFLRGKLWKIPEGKKTCIFDIDGTIACLQHRLGWIQLGSPCPNCAVQRPEYARKYYPGWPTVFDEYATVDCRYCYGTKVLPKKYHDVFYKLVKYDKPIEIVIKWIQACYPEFHVLIVSGRSPEVGGEGTVKWLEKYNIKYDHLLMRRAHVHGPDHEEKQLILDDILKVIPKEDIVFVVDDRPSVVEMWRKNGLRVIPVRGREDDTWYTTGDCELATTSNNLQAK